MYLKEILEDTLPTKWSRRIMGMTIVASPIAYILPKYWPFSILPMTDTVRQILQVLLSVSTLLIGTLACLILVIFAFHKQKEENKSNLEKQRNELMLEYKKIKNDELYALKKEHTERISILTKEIEDIRKQLAPKDRTLNPMLAGFSISPKKSK